ncbi:uncharacterized protein N7479_004239 [Penicillium vulpinum]|uniref:Uncharacterized protein n=1 Tax=Penicillium vulpinum TaxID=29845 RepID=A0A1V6SBR7_9EURO|nr:uncharacterized protein N7479_004239 [Penicillium vulpinum]KAJ5964363.1 hypothetical protein N7479_004239 [Penicillium vulpinum]OQE11376.1 hypothetical protein PENVUL_c002G04961 [Penicillium vulpinum]
MSSTPGKKKSDYMGDLTGAEVKLLMASILCTNGKLDTEKLGKLTDMKRKSAASRFPTLKRKLEKIFEDKLDMLDDQPESPMQGKPSPAKSRAKRREKVVEQEPNLELETKTEAKSGESIETPVKLEAKSEDEIEIPEKSEADIVIKPEPID